MMTAGTKQIPSHNRGLDVIRGVAALLVVLGHARQYLFAAHGLDQTGTGVSRWLLAPTSFAQESVAVFFVLSGYLVGGQVLRQVTENRFNWSLYLAKRLSRLWTVLLPGLLLTASADVVSRRLMGHERFNELVEPHSSGLAGATCNVLFMMPERCLEYGSNQALWSLGYEFWFYIVFAALTVAFATAARRPAYAMMLCLIAVGCIVLFGIELLFLMPTWLIGVAIAAYRGRSHGAWSPTVHHRLLSLTVLACTAAATYAAQPAQPVLYAIGIATVPLMLVSTGGEAEDSSRLTRAAVALGDWSYSLYVYHLPMIVFLVAATAGMAVERSTLALVSSVYGLAFAVLFPAYLFSRITEQHTGLVRTQMVTLVKFVVSTVPQRRL